MASAMTAGAASGRARVRPTSTTARSSSRYEEKSAAAGTAASPFGVVVDQTRRVLELAAFGEDFDPALRRAELLVAVARELDAALEERERRVERQIALLELLHDLFEFGDCGLEVLDGRGRRSRSGHAIRTSRIRRGRRARLRQASRAPGRPAPPRRRIE